MPVPDIFETLGRVVLTFQSAPQGVPGRIWDELRPWFSRLAVNAAPKWLPRLSFGFACSVPRPDGKACPRPAIAACDVCQQPCCLDHARIDQYGDGICYLCCIEAILRKQAERGGQPAPGPGAHARGHAPPPPAPRDRELQWARKTLGVKKAAEWEEVRSAHRKMSAKWHPDRHQGAGYAAAEQKFKDVQRAFDLLTKEHEKKEAA
jgi:hypothetical protein